MNEKFEKQLLQQKKEALIQHTKELNSLRIQLQMQKEIGIVMQEQLTAKQAKIEELSKPPKLIN